MKFPSLPRFKGASFQQQLTVTFLFGLLIMSLLSSIGISTLSYQIVRDKWILQGRQSTEAFAAQSALALLYDSKENAEEPARRFLAFPDVRGVAVYNIAHQILLARGQPLTAVDSGSQWPISAPSTQETADAWYFTAPVFAHNGSEQEPSPFEAETPAPELIGYVRLGIGKQSLNIMQKQILLTTLTVASVSALLFLLYLLAMSRRLTSPIKQLAHRMGQASAGEKKVRAKLNGPRDITDMGAAFNSMMEVLETREKQLETARDAALDSARMKGEFAATVSHELRTPLNAVLGMLELLQDMGLTPKQLEYSMIARNAGEALLKLIEDILDFSRIEAGMLKRQPVDFVLYETLDEVVELMAGQAHRKNLQLDYDIVDDIPLVLNGEASRVRQVLINLVGNALKFTEQGSIYIKVNAEQSDNDSTVLRFNVIDTGMGIPAAAQAGIFEAFVQADGSSTRHYEGAGLGLAICRQLVKLMGGQIGVDSQPGQGSCFWFTVPFAPPCGSRILLESRQAYFAHLRILLVTENDKMRQFLAHSLDHWHIHHSHCSYGIRAVDILRSASEQDAAYQFAIIDLKDAGDNGWIDLIARDPALTELKIILLSNPGNPNRMTNLPNVAANLTKPIQASRLYDFILTVGQNYQEPSPAAVLPTETPRPEALGYSILIVEDNRASQMVAAGMLDRLGCTYEIAASGVEALEWLQRKSFDLVLMDCHMPNMDGFEATRRIRLMAEPVGLLPIVAMTANARQGDNDLCLSAGMNDYLSKPIKLSPLRDKLLSWLDQRSKPAEPNPLPANIQTLETLDNRVLNQLREEIGQGFVKMLGFYLEDTPQQIEQIGLTLTTNDYLKLRDLAHSLKGASRNLGAEKLAAIARQLEEQADRQEIEAGDALLAQLREEYRLIEQLLQQESGAVIDEAPAEPFGPRILIADDDRAMRFALQDILEKDGYVVDVASTGHMAVNLSQRNMADLILMDAMMPELNGFEACKHIRALPNGAEVPILMITALEDEHSVELAFSTGANDYIPKPIHFAVLRKRIALLLEASHSQRTLNRLAYHDPLTNLANRAQFMDRLNTVINCTANQEYLHAVLFLDLDRFKLTNDTMGHDVGDQMLKAAAERIQGCVRKEDLVSRFGGDEFTLLLEKIDGPHIAAAVADKICRNIAMPFVLMEQEFYISASIGISLFPGDGVDSGLLIKHADTAMYRAKEQGNTYCFYEDSMEFAVSSKLRLESDLRRALRRHEFYLNYQPQIDLASGRIIGAEALIRWQHPELGFIPPDVFIPVAEEIGLIEDIGAWVLQTACRQNQTWQQAGYAPFIMAVNVSARQLDQEYFSTQVIDIVAQTGLPPEYLELELTESLFIRHPERKRAVLAQLKEAGMQISIDDFGTGYSSLDQLKQFEFDKLKIDKSFVANIMDDADDAAIVLAIISIAKILKFKVIAEGVETEQQAQYLLQHDCGEAQGYLFGKPMAAEAFTRMLDETHHPRAQVD
ncbi:EAL domain-containing protein [Methylomonas methanica]|uniref:Response regulator receiver modulated diguanylate cyclase/phosphodiesterase n=1 Tax=Methylomonas methanica (strain DSM 25384 / MC09) TaxID=857087 RepID=F9ZVS2_METMM|nr:EAL domain-containing protein [Methylomonas methanica]AEF99550.1 response regulator receiver modulated diguanylate cyclase/phosphodiesterase [Methylomonas methanica MC09]